MRVSRRQLCQWSVFGTGALVLPGCELLGSPERLSYSASKDAQGQYHFAAFDQQGTLKFRQPVAERGHSIALDPRGRWSVLLARRPGRQAYVVDAQQGTLVKKISAGPQRHFYGHGVFSPDGRYLFATENAYDRGHGVISVRDSREGFALVSEFSSHGIGPHEVRMLSDGRTLVVANGGIQTHPDKGRDKLNLATMAPSLAYIDSQSGQLLGAYTTPYHQASIRHLALGARDEVVVAMQYQGSRQDIVPLVGIHRGQAQIALCQAADENWQQLNHYTASACIADAARHVAVTCPRANLVSFWHLDTGRLLKLMALPDAGGVALSQDGQHFVVSTGSGGLHWIDSQTLAEQASLRRQYAQLQWDNHLMS